MGYFDGHEQELKDKVEAAKKKFTGLSEQELSDTIIVKNKTAIIQEMHGLATKQSRFDIDADSMACGQLLAEKRGIKDQQEFWALLSKHIDIAQAQVQEEDLKENESYVIPIQFKFTIPMLQRAMKGLSGKKLSEAKIKELIIEKELSVIDPREKKQKLDDHVLLQFCAGLISWLVEPKEVNPGEHN